MALHHGWRRILSRGRRDKGIAAGNNCQQELFKGLNRLNPLDRDRFDSHPVPSLRPGHRRHECCTPAQIEGAVRPRQFLLKVAAMRLGLSPTVPKSVVLFEPRPKNLGIDHLWPEWLFLCGWLAPPFRPMDRCSSRIPALPFTHSQIFSCPHDPWRARR